MSMDAFNQIRIFIHFVSNANLITEKKDPRWHPLQRKKHFWIQYQKRWYLLGYLFKKYALMNVWVSIWVGLFRLYSTCLTNPSSMGSKYMLCVVLIQVFYTVLNLYRQRQLWGWNFEWCHQPTNSCSKNDNGFLLWTDFIYRQFLYFTRGDEVFIYHLQVLVGWNV